MAAQLHSVTIAVRGLDLRGTAYVPSERDPLATAVLHHGFSGNRIEASRLFVILARSLVERGFAVVAMDRAGHGESDGDFADISVSQEVADCSEVLDRIVELPWVDSDNLHLVGLSLGAVIASIVAAETSWPVRSLTLWSVASLFVDEITGGHLQGKPVDEVDRDGFFDFRGQRLGPSFFDDARHFDVFGRAEGFGGPVRVLHGDLDFIPARYAEAYVDVYGDRMHYTLVEGGDHTWESVACRDFVVGETVSFIEWHHGSG